MACVVLIITSKGMGKRSIEAIPMVNRQSVAVVGVCVCSVGVWVCVLLVCGCVF